MIETTATFAPEIKHVSMEIEQLKQAFEKSNHFSEITQIGDDTLILPSETWMDGIHTTIRMAGDSNCVFQHPAVLYETAEQATLFLQKCKESAIAHSDIEFYDDPVSKCIMAICRKQITCAAKFLNDVDKSLMDFVDTVKAIRNSIATSVWDAIAPVIIDCPTRSLFYLSLMQPYDCPWGWSGLWNSFIDWNDVRTVWKRSKSVLFIPLIEDHIEKTIAENIEQFLKGDPGYLVAYFGLVSYASDTCDVLGIEDMTRRFFPQYGCRTLRGIKIIDSFASPHKIALVSILK